MNFTDFRNLIASANGNTHLPLGIVKAMYIQSQFETGNFTSNLFKNHNNLFGMRAPNSRKLYNNITSSNFASYPDKLLSAIDYIGRQKQFGISLTQQPDGYVRDTLNSRYVANANLASSNEEVHRYYDHWMAKLGYKTGGKDSAKGWGFVAILTNLIMVYTIYKIIKDQN